MRRRVFLACGAGFGIAAARPSDSWKTLVAAIETQVPTLLRELNVPGFSIAVVANGSIRYRRGFGLADVSSGKPVNVDTMFEAASMSKPVFAYAALKLCETRVLDLDKPLSRYGQPLAAFRVDDPRLDRITARRVLSHTAGFPNWRSEPPLRISFTPGERWQYSGEGYCYLQSVMNRLTGHGQTKECARYEGGVEFCGTDFEQYMRNHLFDPFEMSSARYAWSDSFAPAMARPHDGMGRPMANKKSTPPDVARYGSSGALLCTPTDYAKFLLEVLDPKPRDSFRLGETSLHEMLRPQITAESTNEYIISWGLGWRIARAKEGVFVGHGGDNAGFHSLADACVARKSGYVAMTNGENGAELLKKLAPYLSKRLCFL